jgi:hypothetical protein
VLNGHKKFEIWGLRWRGAWALVRHG